ncbi:2-C-methyl-D-erythritol 4-phosphate cytidylyltransferase [Porphyromonas pogonae]|uniref:2-C-methyl-D-erythritol 4-phosphate cytidylyltransferase n=1 Tax=Porphyromonas pogonae TaxID=867595 RepID=UPI002E774BB3|nr:2-C-methyl-D-erythritol 4-phosphate cytidylyltransferase [Porphyromonas pogonae]
MNTARRYAIIVAGGKGLRMGTDLPKQFIPIGGIPVLMHTLAVFERQAEEIVLVIPHDHQDYWEQLVDEYGFSVPHIVADGGDTRFQSVKNGLQALGEKTGDSDLVAVHDGVRPLVSVQTIEQLYTQAAIHGAAIPYRPITESIRHREGNVSKAVDRSDYIAIQTPQVFRLDMLSKAYDTEYKPLFTDDASVFENTFDNPIALVESNVENIKLTTPTDLIIAEHLLPKDL